MLIAIVAVVEVVVAVGLRVGFELDPDVVSGFRLRRPS